ncbi:ubiX [Wigglesworthia glossinidia endosymbiont of Glossina brevipalpis]|uniref:Flavin prenyltransferase UbiX n=1 Tax=Wigglesworthia glossinidia brevipalpis TaxID=36870 RepID=Q8D2P0_WIGBR|nr:ubiX [Wigglesworthia glossinidia endosymbiont of Glossina brevipalpis]
MKNLIIGISGASGVIYGIRLLKILKELNSVITHLIISDSAKKTLSLETNLSLNNIYNMSNVIHNINDISDNISSGSYKTIGMIILPCSIKTLSGIVNSYNDNLLIRAADVVLKEKRKLLLGVRETPLHIGHLRLMTLASEMGAIIMPPMPAFYYNPKNIDDIINHTVGRFLDKFNFNISNKILKRWNGGVNKK